MTVATYALMALQSILDGIVLDEGTFRAMTKDRRGGGSRLAAMRLRMLTKVQGGVCTKCGEHIDETLNSGTGHPESAQWAHLIPKGYFGGDGANGGDRMGWVDGNMTVWHKRCNDAHGETVTTADMLARPELVFTGPWRYMPK
jgi:5-methylcytosine-specific restriction endonuclease McrA